MVRRVITYFYQEVGNIHRAAYVLAIFSFGSQLLALVRDRLLAQTFGAGETLDIYYAAFRVPDVLFVLFASVLSVYVLLPFVTSQTHDGRSQLLSQLFTLFLGVYVLVAGVLLWFAPWYLPQLFPGIVHTDELVAVTRILLCQPLLLGLSSLFGVVTQLRKRFAIYAISPLLYNLGIIFGVAVLYDWFGLSGLALGVVLGAAAHLVVQLPVAYREGVQLALVRQFDWTLLREILSVSIPRSLTLSVNQLVLLVFTTLATVMAAGSVSAMQLAFNLQSVPLVIVGMSYSVAAFPTLVALYADRDWQSFTSQLTVALRHIIFWSLPIAALIIVLRAQLVRVLFGVGEFDWSDTRLTAAVLAVFVLSLVAQAALLLLVRAFYAGGHTRLPLISALIGSGSAIVAALLLQQFFYTHPTFAYFLESLFRIREVPGTEVIVLPIAFTLGAVVQLVVLLWAARRVFGLSLQPVLMLFMHALAAGVMGGFMAYLALQFVVGGVNQDTFVGIALQGAVGAMAGMIGVVATYWILHSPELKEIYTAYRAKLFKPTIVSAQSDSL